MSGGVGDMEKSTESLCMVPSYRKYLDRFTLLSEFLFSSCFCTLYVYMCIHVLGGGTHVNAIVHAHVYIYIWRAEVDI